MLKNSYNNKCWQGCGTVIRIAYKRWQGLYNLSAVGMGEALSQAICELEASLGYAVTLKPA
jgi:hypothetical protein